MPATIPTAESVVKPRAVQMLALMNSHDYEVPDYQREFTWKKRHCEALWNDIEDLAKLNIGAKKYGTHFLGPVVLMVPANGGRTQVIDGQQRLTSFSVILTCLLD